MGNGDNVKLYRYSVDDGEFGGVVVAADLQEAKKLVRKSYPNVNDILVWDAEEDDYYNEDNPNVLECYGL